MLAEWTSEILSLSLSLLESSLQPAELLGILGVPACKLDCHQFPHVTSAPEKLLYWEEGEEIY